MGLNDLMMGLSEQQQQQQQQTSSRNVKSLSSSSCSSSLSLSGQTRRYLVTVLSDLPIQLCQHIYP
jgi:hypothetical protein